MALLEAMEVRVAGCSDRIGVLPVVPTSLPSLGLHSRRPCQDPSTERGH